MDFYVCLERPGYRVARRRRCQSRVGVQHRVTKEDAIKLQAKIITSLLPLLTGKYDAILAITAKKLMMNVGIAESSDVIDSASEWARILCLRASQPG